MGHMHKILPTPGVASKKYWPCGQFVLSMAMANAPAGDAAESAMSILLSRAKAVEQVSATVSPRGS